MATKRKRTAAQRTARARLDSGGPEARRRQTTAESPRAELTYEPGPWEYYSSARVLRARYDRKNLILEVDWTDGGLSYQYFGVEPSVWRNLNRAVSKGKFVNRVLNNYDYAPKVD